MSSNTSAKRSPLILAQCDNTFILFHTKIYFVVQTFTTGLLHSTLGIVGLILLAFFTNRIGHFQVFHVPFNISRTDSANSLRRAISIPTGLIFYIYVYVSGTGMCERNKPKLRIMRM